MDQSPATADLNLPPELERIIFEYAALLHPNIIPNIMLPAVLKAGKQRHNRYICTIRPFAGRAILIIRDIFPELSNSMRPHALTSTGRCRFAW
jgi:hypothetical protein